MYHSILILIFIFIKWEQKYFMEWLIDTDQSQRLLDLRSLVYEQAIVSTLYYLCILCLIIFPSVENVVFSFWYFSLKIDHLSKWLQNCIWLMSPWHCVIKLNNLVCKYTLILFHVVYIEVCFWSRVSLLISMNLKFTFIMYWFYF